MKILKYDKKKNGMYQVFFDNGNNIDLHENIILKYDLLIKKEISSDTIEKMLDENQIYIAYDLSIRYISTKMRSKKEICEFLSKNNIDSKVIDKVIDMLTKEKYIDDNNYADCFVNDRIILSNDGPEKIRRKLHELGINDDAISLSLEKFNEEIQKEKIEKLATKQINVNRNKSNTLLKNKIIDYICSLGYYRSMVIDIVKGMEFCDDSDIAKKEYDKIYKKLSRKYSGDELEFKVKQKMNSLGFRNNY